MNILINKLSHALTANMISTFVSFLTTLIVPKFFGVDITQFGYYQIFVFYVGYIGFFHFGWCDGLYLRDGGKDYSELDSGMYSIQFRLLTVIETIIALLLSIYAVCFIENPDYRFIILMIALNIVLVIPQTMLSFILQATNRIKEYAYITITSRIVFGVLLIIIFLVGYKDYKLIVVGYNISYVFSLIISCLACRKIVVAKAAPVSIGISEAFTNISIGIKLMISNIMSLLIIGVTRWGIQMQWDVVTFAKVSFSLSVTNMFLLLINAIGLVLYPMLRRKDEEKLVEIYKRMSDILLIFLFGVLIFYYPIKVILTFWLPQYIESMEYMAILLPVCVYSAKMSMLVTTYMKVFRFEKLIMIVNFCGLIVASMSAVISTFVLQNLTIAILSIILNQMFICVIAEYVLSRKIKIKIGYNILLELSMTISFIFFSWSIGGWIGMLLYLLCYFAYLVIKWQDIKLFVKEIELLKSSKSA